MNFDKEGRNQIAERCSGRFYFLYFQKAESLKEVPVLPPNQGTNRQRKALGSYKAMIESSSYPV